MKKSASAKRGPPDANQPPSQPEKIGWIRKFCGRGIFREIWRNRYVVLKGDQLYISEKEVKDEKKIQEVFDLTDYEKSEELRKSKSRSKKNHSKFTLLRCRQPGNTVPNLVFLAVSPEEKESWINALNGAITRAKNRILDEASTSTSDGMLTLDLIQEEDSSSPEGPPGTCEKSFRVDLDKSVSQLAAGRRRSETEGPQPPGPGGAGEGKAESPSRRKETSWERQKPEKGERGPAGARTPQVARRPGLAGKSKCASMEEILSEGGSRASPNSAPPQVQQLQDLIAQKLERTRELLAETRDRRGKDKGPDSEGGRAEAEQLLQEAAAAWGQARDVLQEVKELRALCQRLDPNPSPAPLSPSQLKSPQQSQYRKSMM
nr:PREDICTED: pleckstrin homology domain-containing family O member 1 [Lepisosteus oculatus]